MPLTMTVKLVSDNGGDDGAVGAFLDFLGDLAWPLAVVVIIYWLRTPLKELLNSLADRVKDPRTDVQISGAGVAITRRIEVAQAEIEVLRVEQDRLKGLVAPPSRAGIASATDAVEQLQAMAREYDQIQIDNKIERVRRKNELADRLANFAIASDIPHDQLAQGQGDGMIVALATTLIAQPREKDDELLLRAAVMTRSKHARYRVALAVVKLVERRLVRRELVEPIAGMLRGLAQGADPPLERMIQRAMAATELYQKESFLD